MPTAAPTARSPRRRRKAAGLAGLTLLLAMAGAIAQDIRFFRIGTGNIGGTYFPIGGILASAISGPPGAPDCEVGGTCGVPGLIAVAQASSGSVENIANLRAGAIESGLAQADIAYWAHSGTQLYADEPPFAELRLIAHLYDELIHVVVRADSDIAGVADLAGRRVSVGEEGSGTLIDSRLILGAHGIDETDIEPLYLSPDASSDALAADDIDAFFMTGGAPVLAVADLARRRPIRLLPITGPAAEALRQEVPFFTSAQMPAEIYPGVEAVDTVAVGALWVTTAAQDEDLVHGIAQALWHPTTQALLERGHPRGAEIRLENAIRSEAVPLHPGAARYYEEAGLLAADEPAAP